MRAFVRIAVDLPDHPKVVEAETRAPGAAWLFVAGLCYCGKHLTDGRIPKAQVARLTLRPNAKAVRALLAVGLWHEVDGVYEVHEYLGSQSSRAQVEAERKAARVRANTRRSSREQSPNPDRTSPDVQAESARSSAARSKNQEQKSPPNPPPSGGLSGSPRANGTSPRQLVDQAQQDRDRARAHHNARDFGERMASVEPGMHEPTEYFGRQYQHDPQLAQVALDAYHSVVPESTNA